MAPARTSTPGSTHWRCRAAIAAAVLVLLIGLGAVPEYGIWTALPASCAGAGAAGMLVAGRRARYLLPIITVSAGSVSLSITASVVLTGNPYPESFRAGTAGAMVESAALFVLTMLTVRAASARWGGIAAVVSGIAIPSWLFRFGWDNITTELIGGYAAWTLVPVLAAAIGLYLRALDERRDRTVAEARRAQRDQLARDLHDFVAHDISGMLAQAQAGRLLAERDPEAAAAAFQRIEEAGMKALTAMDHTVHSLHRTTGDDGGDRGAPRTLVDLPDVVERFSRTGQTAARLELDPQLQAADLPRELGATAYRLVMEALTNVRRHAPGATQVVVSARRTTPGSGVEVVIVDDGPAACPPPTERRGGLGLSGLTARVEALGGTLTAGPMKPTGWRVAALLPMRQHGRRSHG
jgi:signal transduction histidine kinase